MATLSIYPPSALDAYKKVKLRYSPAIDAACEEIDKACEGFLSSDYSALVKILGPLSPNDRALVGYRYKELHDGKTLRELIKSETSGDFGYLLQLAVFSLPQAEAYILFHAMKGLGTSEQLMYPIIFGRTNEELNVLKKTFFEMYNQDLSVMVSSELGGDFKAAVMLALQEPLIEYKASFHTKAKAEEDAELLYKAGEGKWGTDEGTFLRVLLSSPPKHLLAIDAAYAEKHEHGIVKAIKNEFSGTANTALVFYARLTLEPWVALAELFEASMKGLGTDESALSADCIRYHPYLNKIKAAYETQFKLSLRERIHGEATGKYQELLLHIVDAPASATAFA